VATDRMHPDQLRRAAELVRAKHPVPDGHQRAEDYMLNTTIHALASALDQIAAEAAEQPSLAEPRGGIVYVPHVEWDDGTNRVLGVFASRDSADAAVDLWRDQHNPVTGAWSWDVTVTQVRP
jgi:hypothetical protein